jgi:hypothetical protein
VGNICPNGMETGPEIARIVQDRQPAIERRPKSPRRIPIITSLNL